MPTSPASDVYGLGRTLCYAVCGTPQPLPRHFRNLPDGLVSLLEDCIEELVGEIVDEYDTEEAEVQHLADGELLVDGGLPIDELADLLGTELPDEDWDTVGGFVLGTLGHVPTPGECVEHSGHRFVADEVEGRRIAKVRVDILK